ncbi:MAG TPA: GDSL-type esterase/lipase family protein [Candidatus Krumholzibacteria bacterium]|nr:GDSL-type esterase/lipase family protein [Candidatus Krumholzibacteria bacterium]
MPSPQRRRSVVQLLLILSGWIFLSAAILFNTRSIELGARVARTIFHRPFLTPDVWRIHDALHVYLIIATALFFLAWLCGRVPAVDRWVRRPLVEKVSLALLVVAVPLVWLEVGLRPFLPGHEKTTTLFLKDETLGWKLRPGAVDRWGDVEVRVNERGFRGPVVPYEKPPGTSRLVYLGDSVTFGYRVARWEDTYPFVADSLLRADSLRVDTVNLAVEGYSQWQQAIVLAQEGDRYRPDLVVVGFVLNDVTEMFYLSRFGGSDEGFQLRHSYSSAWDRVLSKSALVYQIQNVTREIKARRKLGEDVRLGAIKQQALDVETLMKHPDQGNVKVAWDIALADLQRIVDHCATQNTDVLVVAFPFAVQLSDPEGLAAPQRVLSNYARARNIPSIDLLPELVSHMQTSGRRAQDLFIDHDHLSVEGHRVVAGILAPRIAAILGARRMQEVAP